MNEGLGCRLPNLYFFAAFTLILSDHVVASKALTVFQQFRRFFHKALLLRVTVLPMSLPRYHSSIPLCDIQTKTFVRGIVPLALEIV